MADNTADIIVCYDCDREDEQVCAWCGCCEQCASAPGACFDDCAFAEARRKADSERLAAVHARLKAATPGPWRYENGTEIHGTGGSDTHYVSDVVAMGDDDPPLCSFYSRADAEFVAAAPDDIGFLLTHAATIESRLQTMTVNRDRARDDANHAERQRDAAERDLVHWADRFNATDALTRQEDGAAYQHTNHAWEQRDLHCPACWAATISHALSAGTSRPADARLPRSASPNPLRRHPRKRQPRDQPRRRPVPHARGSCRDLPRRPENRDPLGEPRTPPVRAHTRRSPPLPNVRSHQVPCS